MHDPLLNPHTRWTRPLAMFALVALAAAALCCGVLAPPACVVDDPAEPFACLTPGATP